MYQIALYQPQIPPNTGNIIRLVANNGCKLHLIKPLGFTLDEKPLRRAGLDYHDLANVSMHDTYDGFIESVGESRVFAITTKGKKSYADVKYQKGDVLLFGSETAGLPDEVRESIGVEHCLKIPMIPNNRSINLSNSVAIVCYEAWRQIGFEQGG